MMKLLIVDDNPEMRRVLRRMLDGLADEVTECDDGDQVLAAYADCRPDWVLMDVEMKRMDGIAATRELLTREPAARVLIVTNYDNAGLRQAAQAAGACGYVLKANPFDLRRTLRAV